MFDMVEDDTLKKLFENIQDNNITVAEAASRLNINALIDKKITGRQLAALIVSYFFLKESQEIAELCSSISSMKQDNYEALWIDTKNFPIKKGGKPNVFHINITKLISKTQPVAKDVVSLSKFVSTKSAKNMPKYMEQMYESVVEIHGVCEALNSQIKINREHDIANTIPRPKRKVESREDFATPQETEDLHTATKRTDQPCPVTASQNQAIENQAIENDTSVQPMDWASLNEPGDIIDPLDAFARVYKKK